MNRYQIDKGAVLYKPHGCSVWHLDLTTAGHRRRVSLHTSNKDNALVLARQLVQESLADKWSLAIPREIPFAEFVPVYEQHARAHNAPGTVELNLRVVQAFQAHVKTRLQHKRRILLSDITPETIDSYKLIRRENGIQPWTINRDLGALSTFFSLARRKNLIRNNPVFRVQKVATVKRIPRTLLSEEVERLLQEAQKPIPLLGPGRIGNGNTRPRFTPLKDMFYFALNTGARLSEMLYVEWADIDLNKGIVSFRCKPEHQLKDREERTVSANSGVSDMLRRRRLSTGSSSRWIFPSTTGGVILREHALRELKKVASRAGVPWVNWQVLRRTFLTVCAASGVPSFVLKSIAGHSSIRTTEEYYIGAVGGALWKPPVIGA